MMAFLRRLGRVGDPPAEQKIHDMPEVREARAIVEMMQERAQKQKQRTDQVEEELSKFRRTLLGGPFDQIVVPDPARRGQGGIR